VLMQQNHRTEARDTLMRARTLPNLSSEDRNEVNKRLKGP